MNLLLPYLEHLLEQDWNTPTLYIRNKDKGSKYLFYRINKAEYASFFFLGEFGGFSFSYVQIFFFNTKVMWNSRSLFIAFHDGLCHARFMESGFLFDDFYATKIRNK